MVISYNFTTKSGAPAKPALNKFMREIKNDIAKAEVMLLVKSTELAEKAAFYMAQRVRNMTKRTGATGELAEALEKSVKVRKSQKSNFTITVGNTEDLPEYWAMINYGGYIKSGYVPGLWSDTKGGSSNSTGAGKGQFGYMPSLGDEVGWMLPKKPIKGFQYIAYAHVKMLSYVKNKFSIFK